jgi:hypothetical protein
LRAVKKDFEVTLPREKCLIALFVDDSERKNHLVQYSYHNSSDSLHAWILSSIGWKLFVKNQLFVLDTFKIAVHLVTIKKQNNQEKHQRSLYETIEKQKEGEIY